MTPDSLRNSALTSSEPPVLPMPLLALWWEARGEWMRAHEAVQAEPGAASAWVHAYLHRREGDLANADYWYARAGRRRSVAPLDTEWKEICAALLAAREC